MFAQLNNDQIVRLAQTYFQHLNFDRNSYREPTENLMLQIKLFKLKLRLGKNAQLSRRTSSLASGAEFSVELFPI